jgi:hypothetical protein
MVTWELTDTGMAANVSGPLPAKPGWSCTLTFRPVHGTGWVLREVRVGPTMGPHAAPPGETLTGEVVRAVPFAAIHRQLAEWQKLQVTADAEWIQEYQELAAEADGTALGEWMRRHPPSVEAETATPLPVPHRAGGRPKSATTDDALLELAVAVDRQARANASISGLAADRHQSIDYLYRLIRVARERGLLTAKKRLTAKARRMLENQIIQNTEERT